MTKDQTLQDIDLLILGSGIAGLTCALVADELGLRALVVEKEPLIGGASAYSEAMVWVPGSRQAQAAEVRDTPEAAVRYLVGAAAPHADLPRIEAYVRTAAEALAFLEDHAPVRYELTRGSVDYQQDLPGASCGARALTPLPFDGRGLGGRLRDLRWPLATTMIFGSMSVSGPNLPHFYRVGRSIRSTAIVAGLFLRFLSDRLRGYGRGTVLTGGNGVLGALVQALDERRVPILTSARVESLSQLGGRVEGVRLSWRGASYEVRARAGVVLACGGYAHSPERTARTHPHVATGKAHHSLVPAGNVGDGLALAESAGGYLNDALQHPAAWAPTSLVPVGAARVPFPHFGDRAKPGVMAVDRRGRRFANEATSYHRFVPAMIAAADGDAEVEAFLLADHRAIRRYGLGVVPPFPGRIGPHLRSGYLTRGRIWPELAAQLGLPASALTDTIEHYNAAARRGLDPQFHKGEDVYARSNGDPAHTPNPNVGPLDTPPYYAVRLVPGDLGTFAGIATDVDGRVVRRDGSPVPGLYAIGSDAASAFGGAYPAAGINVGPALTFAYRTARHARQATGVTAPSTAPMVTT
jgi:hypothetical protein